MYLNHVYIYTVPESESLVHIFQTHFSKFSVNHRPSVAVMFLAVTYVVAHTYTVLIKVHGRMSLSIKQFAIKPYPYSVPDQKLRHESLTCFCSFPALKLFCCSFVRSVVMATRYLF